MVHFGVQFTVKVLQEGVVIDCCVMYDLGINYINKKAIMKLIMNFEENKMFVSLMN